MEEFKNRREMQAVWRAEVSGHNVVRKGRFWLD